MGRRRDLRGRDARARAVSDRAERHSTARQVIAGAVINHRLFVPSPLRAFRGPAPLIVALHGCTQTATDFAAGTRFDSVAERAGAYVVYPEQSVRANPQRCWNWYLEANQSREHGEPAHIVALVDDLAERLPIDRKKIFIAGLSAGGAMAAILAEQAPDRFAAVGIMAGVPLHVSHDLESARSAMRGDGGGARAVRLPSLAPDAYSRLRVTVWTGATDRRVAPVNASLLAHQFLGLIDLDRATSTLEVRSDAEIVRWHDATGRVRVETWCVVAMGHAWSGGSFRGSHTHPKGPHASDEMMAFFLETSSAPRA